jgi:fatty acid amide hydrolase 2
VSDAESAQESLLWSASRIASAVRVGEVDPRDVLAAHIRRIERVNPRLNALVSHRFERAQSDAELVIERLTAGETLPLAGVPFVVKETIAVEGLPHSAGSLLRSHQVAEENAVAVQRLVHAGAIPVGVSNTSELGFGYSDLNLVYGGSRNPWNHNHSAGGSSGADAGLVASGCVPFALTSDWMGSTMAAAGLCGVFGHKPTGGAVPTSGMLPRLRGRSRRYLVGGPIARSAADLELLMRTISGPHPSDQSGIPIRLGSAEEVDWTWRRVLVCDALGEFGNRPSRDVRRAIRDSSNVLQSRGADVEVWRPTQFARAGEIWLSMMHEGFGLTHSFAETLSGGRRISLVLELILAIAGRNKYTPSALAMVLLERMTKGSYAQIQKFCAEGRRLRERINDMLRDGGVLVMPAWPDVAPTVRGVPSDPRHMLFAALLNVLELPASTAPVGRSRSGLPLAVMFVGAQGNDAITIAAARAVEENVGGWIPPKTGY